MEPITGTIIADTAWHAVKRTASVIVVLALCVGIPYIAYEKGKTKGYSLCAKDRPTYGQVGTVNTCDPKEVPMTILRIFRIGIIWNRK